MILITDVHYDPSGTTATAAGIVVREWTDAVAVVERTATITAPEPYVPGDFARRELPALLAVVAATPEAIDAVVVDGYVWLDGGRPGLGARLHARLGERAAVVGIAKNEFAGATAIDVVRGTSAKPLHVTAVGIDAAIAARHVAAMHGPHRLPTLVVRADHLCRGLKD